MKNCTWKIQRKLSGAGLIEKVKSLSMMFRRKDLVIFFAELSKFCVSTLSVSTNSCVKNLLLNKILWWLVRFTVLILKTLVVDEMCVDLHVCTGIVLRHVLLQFTLQPTTPRWSSWIGTDWKWP